MSNSVQLSLNGNIQTQLVNVITFGRKDVHMIGRSTKFGNPFRLRKDGGDYTREESVEEYAHWFHESEQKHLREEAVEQLSGKTLGCYCVGKKSKYDNSDSVTVVKDSPSVCHGEVILEFLNTQPHSKM